MTFAEQMSRLSADIRELRLREERLIDDALAGPVRPSRDLMARWTSIIGDLARAERQANAAFLSYDVEISPSSGGSST